MHFKLGLISGLIATASASLSSPNCLNGEFQSREIGKQYNNQYVQPNIEEICFSLRPIASCDDEHVATQIKHQKIGFHCIPSTWPLTKQLKRNVQDGKCLVMENKTPTIKAYVEVPVRCERIDTEKKRLEKQYENVPEQKIHIIQSNDNILSNVNFRDQQEEFKYSEEFSNFENLFNRHLSIESILTMNDAEFEHLMETLKFAAHQFNKHISYSTESQWILQLDHVLPNTFSKVAKKLFNNIITKNTISKEENEELYEQYKELVRRIYAYTVKQMLQMKNYNSFSIQYQPQKFVVLAHNLWHKMQRELTNNQIHTVEQIVDNLERQNLQNVFVDDVLVVANKDQMKQLEHQLTKVLVAGLVFANYQQSNPTLHNEVQRNLEQYSKFFEIMSIYNQKN